MPISPLMEPMLTMAPRPRAAMAGAMMPVRRKAADVDGKGLVDEVFGHISGR